MEIRLVLFCPVLETRLVVTLFQFTAETRLAQIGLGLEVLTSGTIALLFG